MALYVQIQNPKTPDEIAAAVIAYLQTVIPGWVPNAGDLDTILIEAEAREAGELWTLASEVEDAIFRSFGPLIPVTPLDPSAATAPSTWSMRDNLGYTIPAGTQVGIRATGDNLVAFRTLAAVTVPPGSTTTGVGEVIIQAVIPGAAGSGLGGPGVALELLDNLDFVSSAALTAQTTGGVDGETDVEYLNRLATELQLLTRRPILPNDFAILARRVAGVDRVLVLDLYNPNDDTWGNERMVTVVLADASGQPVSPTVRAAVDTLLQSEREINFVVWESDANYTTIDVATTFTVFGGYSGSEVAGRVVAALTAYLSPANWGRPRVGDQHTWLNTPKVRYLELAALINDVEGVNEVESLLFGGSARKAYTVAASTDTLTSTAHGYANGDPLILVTATAGAPLAQGGVYYARDVAANTFKLALTSGGAAIDITTDGSGTLAKVGTADLTMAGVAPLPEPGVVKAATV